jgi:hypothetical protein
VPEVIGVSAPGDCINDAMRISRDNGAFTVEGAFEWCPAHRDRTGMSHEKERASTGKTANANARSPRVWTARHAAVE